MRYFETQRIEFIKDFVEKHGAIKRRDIVHKFHISYPQATNDIAKFNRFYPGVLRYNFKTRQYEVTDETDFTQLPDLPSPGKRAD